MDLPWTSLTGFAGPAGVGAICVLAAFLFLDGRHPNLFPSVEFYAKTSTWSIVAAVPLLVSSYVLGNIMISVSQSAARSVGHLFGKPTPPHPPDIAAFGNEKDSVRVQIFLKAYQDQEMLCGTGIAFILLGLGALSEKRNLPNLSRAINAATVLVIACGIFAFCLSFTKAELAHEIAKSIAAGSVEHAAPNPD